MTKPVKPDLGPVQETLLIPLLAGARETEPRTLRFHLAAQRLRLQPVCPRRRQRSRGNHPAGPPATLEPAGRVPVDHGLREPRDARRPRRPVGDRRHHRVQPLRPDAEVRCGSVAVRLPQRRRGGARRDPQPGGSRGVSGRNGGRPDRPLLFRGRLLVRIPRYGDLSGRHGRCGALQPPDPPSGGGRSARSVRTRGVERDRPRAPHGRRAAEPRDAAERQLRRQQRADERPERREDLQPGAALRVVRLQPDPQHVTRGFVRPRVQGGRLRVRGLPRRGGGVRRGVHRQLRAVRPPSDGRRAADAERERLHHRLVGSSRSRTRPKAASLDSTRSSPTRGGRRCAGSRSSRSTT